MGERRYLRGRRPASCGLQWDLLTFDLRLTISKKLKAQAKYPADKTGRGVSTHMLLL